MITWNDLRVFVDALPSKYLSLFVRTGRDQWSGCVKSLDYFGLVGDEC